VALAVLDFHFLAGDPLHPNALPLFKLLKPGDVVIAPTPAWQHVIAATYPSALAVYRREAFRAEQFDIGQLRRFCQALPIGFELRPVRLEEVTQFATDLDPALIYNFRSHEEFITRGVGVGILHQGMFVSGASSGAVGGGKLEIEIQTHRQFRRRGLATLRSSTRGRRPLLGPRSRHRDRQLVGEPDEAAFRPPRGMSVCDRRGLVRVVLAGHAVGAGRVACPGPEKDLIAGPAHRYNVKIRPFGYPQPVGPPFAAQIDE
jgi:GNAT acetyltransferase